MDRQEQAGPEVRIVRLAPMRVAAALGFGASPELQAWDTLLNWAKEQGALAAEPAARYFGFNNPGPAPGSPNYGYEQWMTVGPDAAGGRAAPGGGEVVIKEFPGGLYAVTRCTLENIGEAWHRLVIWGEDSSYRLIDKQCLEECIDPPPDGPDMMKTRFDLYLAIGEPASSGASAAVVP